MYGIRFGDSTDQAFNVDEEEAYIDSTSSCIVVPDRYFFWLLKKLATDWGISYTSDNGNNVYLDSCTDAFTMPTLYFLIGEYWYEALVDDYVLTNNDQCFVCLERGNDTWVFGAALMRGYYAVFDLDN